MHLKTAWNNIRRSPFQAMSAIFVLSVTFFVVTVLSILVYSFSKVVEYFETRPQIIAFIKESASASELQEFQERIQSDPRVSEVKYVSKENALEIYKQATADNPLLSELIDPSIFPASYEISVTKLEFTQGLIDEISKEPIVDSFGYTAASLRDPESLQKVIDRLKTATFYVRYGGGAFALFLTGTSFLVLMVIISMRMASRKTEVEILDLIGATPGFIKSPILIEGLFYALFGTVIGWFMGFLLVLYATPYLISYFRDIPILPTKAVDLFLIFGFILIIELLVSVMLALVGTLIAVSRFKKY
ncbi:MAG: permease-like cell division protein FtsX [Patescibacteria group bacterium]|nr:permease-like cell division protein FtsX [Patescibacteria group bacterium]